MRWCVFCCLIISYIRGLIETEKHTDRKTFLDVTLDRDLCLRTLNYVIMCVVFIVI